LRALYADVDGTLVGPGGSLFSTTRGTSSRGATAISALHEAGVEIVLVSGRTREQMREAARLVGAGAFIAELGAFVVERGDGEEVTTNFGAFTGTGTPFHTMARSGAGAFLLDRYEGRLEPHTTWAHQEREATMLFRGLVNESEANDALARARYGWLRLCDNGRIRRSFDTLDVPEVRAYHLAPRGVTKAVAVRIHRERRGFRIEETGAVGDSASYVEMAAEVGAMALVGGETTVGATQSERVFLTHDEGVEGFAEAVEKLLGQSPK
jgi:hydroxymethylpyrimidine pyrophosphatase-like HAD family hydrolase